MTPPVRDLPRHRPVEGESDLLVQYLSEASLLPLLTPAEEQAVARRARDGDLGATQDLVARNLRFVVSVAKRYQNRGLALADLVGEGNLGLMVAAHRFDPDRGVRFISYGVWWIRQAILLAIANQGRCVRLPQHRSNAAARMHRVSERLRQQLFREPSVTEIANALDWSPDSVHSHTQLSVTEVRLDAPVGEEGSDALTDHLVLGEPGDEPSDANFLPAEVSHALATLSSRDAEIIRLSFGVDGGEEQTLEQIGTRFGITRERVRQLRDRALKRLREGDAGRALASFAR